MIDTKELRILEIYLPDDARKIFMAAIDRLEAVEKEYQHVLEVKEIYQRQLNETEDERDTLRARIEEMEQQGPVGVLHVGSCYGEELEDWEFEANQCACDKLNEAYVSNPTSLPIYTLPGAQPASSVPEGFALVNAAHFLAVLDREDWRTAKNRAELRAMLAAAPEAKP